MTLFPQSTESPSGVTWSSTRGAAFTHEPHVLERIYLEGLQERFTTLRPRVAILEKLAAEQDIDAIRRVDDVAPLLFPHTVYKSYPLRFLDTGDYGALTRWLSKLTATHLADLKCDGIDSIDDWIDLLDQETPLRLLHSFGTSGKLSFVPRTRNDWHEGARYILGCIRDFNGPQSGPDMLRQPIPIIQPTYQHGATPGIRGVQTFIELVDRTDFEVLHLYPGARFSADVATLAGRLRAAELRGDQSALQLSPSLRRRLHEFREQEAGRPRLLKEFFDRVQTLMRGRDVYLFGVWPVLYDWAQDGLSRGIQGVFGGRTVIHTGGGTKGRTFPPGWQEEIFQFVGGSTCFQFYAMTEMIPACPRCAADHYHVPPTIVPFLLDPVNGQPLPRDVTRRGRFAFVDLVPDSYWGGVITGDEVTLGGWDRPCSCGRPGPYVENSIGRLTLEQGGDDKISCAGAPEAHDHALEYLAAYSH